MRGLLVAGCWLLVGEPAAQEAADLAAPAVVEPSDEGEIGAEASTSGTGLTVGIRAQVGFAQVFSDLGVAPAGELEVGYRLPFLGRRLAIFLAGGYQYTYASGPGTDERLVDPGGAPYPDGWTWDLAEHAVKVTLGFYGRIFAEADAFSPYLWVGPAVYFLESVVTGESGGEAFGENTETSTEFGVGGAVGVEYVLGPGPLFLEVEVGWSPLAHDITGDSTTGQLGLSLGYRLWL